MKKERPVLFPEYENNNALASLKFETSLNDLTLGYIYKIGNPSTSHYQYICPTIRFKEMNITELENFSAIQGMLVKVASILRMVNGEKIAVLRHYEDKLILNRYEKIFANIDNSVTSIEIIPLDLETRRTIDLSAT